VGPGGVGPGGVGPGGVGPGGVGPGGEGPSGYKQMPTFWIDWHVAPDGHWPFWDGSQMSAH